MEKQVCVEFLLGKPRADTTWETYA